MKNFALILSCEKYSFKREQQNKDTLPMEYRYFAGDPKTSVAYEKGDVIYLPCRDEYEYLTKKTLLAFKWIRENIGIVDYILKTDDDVIFNKENITQMVQELHEDNIDYAGILHKGGYRSRHHFGKCTDERMNTVLMPVPPVTYCIGGAYWVSRKAQEILGSIENYKPYFSIFEDACVGNILVSNGIKAKAINIKGAMKWPEL
jgi:hypothetical protein